MAVTWRRIAYQDELHTQDTDTNLGAVDTKNPPIDADKVLYRDSAALVPDTLVTSTWTQIKAFLKTYFDTIFAVKGVNADITSMTGLDDDGIPVAKIANGDIATDTIWAAVGDLVVGTGDDTAGVLSIGLANLKAFVNAAGNGIEWANGMKVGTFTRDLTAADGNVAISGVGFKPSMLIFISVWPGNSITWAISDGTTSPIIYMYGSTFSYTTGRVIQFTTSAGGDGTVASINSIDTDGFTLAYNQYTSRVGTGNIVYLALR